MDIVKERCTLLVVRQVSPSECITTVGCYDLNDTFSTFARESSLIHNWNGLGTYQSVRDCNFIFMFLPVDTCHETGHTQIWRVSASALTFTIYHVSIVLRCYLIG